MKVSDYEIKGAPQDLIDFKDEVTILLNNGKYSSLVVETPPTWSARNGEFVFFNSSSTLRIYFYNNNTWGFIEYPAGGGVLITAVSNNVTTASATLLNVSNNLVAVSNNLTTGSTTLLNVSNNLVSVSNNLTTGSATLLNVSNNLVSVSNNLTTGSTTLLNVSNNLVSVSNNLVTGSTTLLNVSNNLVSVSNNVVTGSTTLLNVSNNLVTASGNIANLIVQATNGALKGWINFNGVNGQLSILDHYNVQSVTREATGVYTISWATTYATTAYPVAGMVVGTGGGIRGYVTIRSGGRGIGSTGILCWDNNGASNIDYQDISIMVTADQ